MRKSWLVFPLLVAPFLIFLLLQSLAPDGQTIALLYADEGTAASHLPLVLAPEATATPTATSTPTVTATMTPTATATSTSTPTPEPGLINGSFEDCNFDEEAQKCNWPKLTDRVQPPLTGWDIYLVPKDEPLFGSPDLASDTSEAKHLEYPYQIPPEEAIGEPEAIIVEGKVTYKIFDSHQAFGTELKQTVSLAPGSDWRLTAPINVHLHGETDPWAAESSVTVNGLPENSWSNVFNMIDRRFCKHTVMFTVPASGQAHISIKVKSKHKNNKDFFIDDIKLTRASDPAPHESMPECVRNSSLSSEHRAKEETRYRDSWVYGGQ